MTEQQSRTIAEILGGKAHHTGGNLWVVEVAREDGGLVVISDEIVCEYASRTAYKDGADVVREILL